MLDIAASAISAFPLGGAEPRAIVDAPDSWIDPRSVCSGDAPRRAPKSRPTAHAAQSSAVELAEGREDRRATGIPSRAPWGGRSAGCEAALASPPARGGGSPGADAPTHWTRTARAGARRVSTATTGRRRFPSSGEGHEVPEWDVHAGTTERLLQVHEVEAKPREGAALASPIARPASRSRLGLGSTATAARPRATTSTSTRDRGSSRGWRVLAERSGLHRQRAPAPRSLRALVLDIPAPQRSPRRGKSVHAKREPPPRSHSRPRLSDRVALMPTPQGRSAVNLMPIKASARIEHHVLQRLGSLEPGVPRLGGDPSRDRRAAGSRRHTGSSGRALRACLRPWLRAGVRGGRCATRAQRSSQPGVGCLCLSVGASWMGRRCGAFGGSATRPCPPRPTGPSSGRCSARPSARRTSRRRGSPRRSLNQSRDHGRASAPHPYVPIGTKSVQGRVSATERS